MVKLSDEQQRIVDSSARYISVLACAGSGKTTTLIERLARLMASQSARPSNIAVITFTNLAADELTLRLHLRLGESVALSEMFVGTIHSFCLHLLREFGGVAGQDKIVISPHQQLMLLNARWAEWDLQDIAPEARRAPLLERLATTLDIIRMESIPPDVLYRVTPKIQEVLELYREYLVDENAVDYAEMLVQVRDRLENDTSFAESVRSRYQWLFVDEYQDVDPVQERIIQLLASGQNLFVVGDDDQAIYQFRGTDVSNVIEFPIRHPNADVLFLSENRRCRENVLRVSERIIRQNHTRVDKKMRPSRSGGQVKLLSYDLVNDEADFIAQEIERLKSAGEISSYSDVAILMRSVASYGELYLDSLRTRRIPHISKGARGLFRRPEIIAIVCSLEFIANSSEDSERLDLLGPILPSVSSYTGDPEDLASLSITETWDAREYAQLNSLLSIRNRYRNNDSGGPLDVVYDVISSLDLFNPLRDESNFFNIGAFTQLVAEYEAIENTKRLNRFLNFIYMHASHSTDEATPIDDGVDAVRVLTIHQAKGLEFQVVFCPMLVERRFPSTANSTRWLIPDEVFESARYRTKIDDERRLFYVAATRAKSQLYLTTSRDVGLRNPVRPSEFFTEASKVDLTPFQDADIPVSADMLHASQSEVLSYSSMEYYLTCPYRFRLHREYKVSAPANPYFEFGRVVHLVAGLMHQMHTAGHQLDDAKIAELYEQNFHVRGHIAPFVLEKRKRSGLKALKGYWHSQQDWFNSALSMETPFSYFVAESVVKGRIDLIVRHGSGHQIVDFKTGGPQPLLRRDFQMQVYALAAQNQLNLSVNRATLIYLEEGIQETFEVNDLFLDEATNSLHSVLGRIQKKDFEATPGKFCTRCEFRKICPWKK